MYKNIFDLISDISLGNYHEVVQTNKTVTYIYLIDLKNHITRIVKI